MNAHQRAPDCGCSCHGNPDMRHMVACCDARQDAQEGRQTPAPAGVASVPTVDATAVLASHRAADYCYCASGPHPWHCYECGQVWRGDAETGGCPAALLAREVVALRERAERAEDILSSLTVGGSEFYRNPERCAENIRQGTRAMTGIREVLGRKLDAAAERAALLLALLRSVEWVNTADGETLYCPRCGQSEAEGHAPACPLGAALRADGEAERGGGET